jgi:hypothetical protein
LTTSFAAYQLLFACLMALCLSLALIVAQRLTGSLAVPLWAAAGMFALGSFSTHRFDAAVALLLVLLLWAALERRAASFGFLLGLAILTKLVPILIAPLWLMDVVRRRARSELVIGAAALLVTVLAGWLPAWLGAGSGVFDALAYQARRPLEIESTAAAILGVAHGAFGTPLENYYSFGSLNVRGAGAALLGTLSNLALGAALGSIYVAAWRRLATDRHLALLQGSVAVLVALMLFGKVFSPQYLIWIVPLGVALSLRGQPPTLRGRSAVLLFLGVLVLTQLIYPVSYAALENLRPWACALVLLRTALLGAWAWRTLR